MTADEARIVTELAEETGLSVSDVVRQALRAAHPERFKSSGKGKRRK